MVMIPTRRRRTSEEAIVDAAYACFQRYGIRKTTLEDITLEAGVSRATIYRHFPNKDAIVEQVGIVETRKAQVKVRELLLKEGPFADRLVEGLLFATRVSGNNPHIRPLVEFSGEAGRTDAARKEAFEANRKTWARLLENIDLNTALAPDISLDDLTSYLGLAVPMLLTKVDVTDVSDEGLRYFIRRFVVNPLLPRAPNDDVRAGSAFRQN